MNTLTKRTLFHVLVGLALASSGPVLAGDLPMASDIAFYRSGSGNTRMEVYLALDRAGITYKKTRRGQAAEVATVVVVKQKRQVVDYKEFTIKDVRPKGESLSGTIIRQASFTLPTGAYEVHIVAEDQFGNRSEQDLAVEVPFFEGPFVDISNGQLASLIRRTRGPSEYLKRGLYVLPNAYLRFDSQASLLWYYAEIYGLTPLDTAEIYTEVWQDDSLIVTRGPKYTPSPSHTLVHWGALNPTALPTGNNELRIRVIAAGDTVLTAKVFSMSAGTTAVSDTGDVLSSLPEARMASFAGGLSLLTELNMRHYRAGDISVKRQLILDAINQVSEKRGGEPTFTIREVYTNWELAKSYDRYQLPHRRLSEQGGILFIYGRPDVIDTYPATNTHREYQVWEYAHGDSVQLAVFLDRKGYGDFTLEHGTLPGRKQNPNWRNQIPRGAMPESPPPPVSMEVEEEPVRPAAIEEPVEPEPAPPSDIIPVETTQDSVVTESALPDSIPSGVPPGDIVPMETLQDGVVTESALPDTIPSSVPAAADTLQTP
ncbi:hypothetical protein ACFL4U_02070 [Candidatus Neomarinimicrobiota bacterium]